MNKEKMIIALAGGVGGAKLAQGLAAALPADELTLVVNTGDDFNHLGLAISPDIDTVMYTLAGINNKETGWGMEGETWEFMKALERLGGEHWFRLGDRDIATHIDRTHRLKKGQTLSSITKMQSQMLDIKHTIVPMSDEAVPTIVHTTEGPLAFQDYFVRMRSEPKVVRIEYQGATETKPGNDFLRALDQPNLTAIVICPSNPFLSIAPIVNLSGIKEYLKKRKIPVVAVSPIIGGKAVKGPAAKIMNELGMDVSAVGVAKYYGDLIDGIVIDTVDEKFGGMMGIECCVTPTMMYDVSASTQLAKTVIDFAMGVKVRI